MNIQIVKFIPNKKHFLSCDLAPSLLKFDSIQGVEYTLSKSGLHHHFARQAAA
jgi:hypothetical protein